ncbi:tail fiber domain-containing protein [bacterium]|nr:tail fiber domain-containing protein [bacterium]
MPTVLANDGTGSGLDADAVDGIQGADLEESAEIDADIAAHAAIADAHHAKTTSFGKLTDTATDGQIPGSIARDSEIMPTVLANDGTGSGLDADAVDGIQGAALEESAEIDADILSHAGVADAHHAKTTSFTELTGAAADAQIPASIARDSEVTSQVATHGGIADAHHARYTNSEAVSAMGVKSDTNPLNHDKTTSLPWGSISSMPAGFVDGIDNDSGGARWSLTGNTGTSPGTNFLGTTNNVALQLHVNNARALRLEPHATSPNVIGGYGGNSITAGAYGATIGGGGQSSYVNSVTGNYGTVSGGIFNTASGYSATVGRGDHNTASSQLATVGGGLLNTSGELGTVGGGAWSLATGYAATVSGGATNYATGEKATVPGGNYNTAAGDYSFAAGRRAIADGDGSFVWGDSNDFDVHAWGANQFVVRATGGYWLFSAVDGSGTPTSGATLAAGSGTWGSWCDRNAKANCVPVHPRAVLEKVAALPISTWSYKTQDPSIRHLGPMAQDFYAAFGLGEDDKHIGTVDADGVALAAIQGLHEIVQEKDARISSLEKQNTELKARLTALEAVVRKLAQQHEGGE